MSKLISAASLAVPALMVGFCVNAQNSSQHPDSEMTQSSATVAPDNTKSNKVNPSNRDAVADRQKNNATDIDLAKRIRQSVVSDKSLSTYAHNVKIVALNGTVTLNGVVNTADERTKVNDAATAIAGPGRVVDQIKVAPPK